MQRTHSLSNSISVQEFLRTSSDDEINRIGDCKPSSLRAENILEYEYRHRSDHHVYPAVKPQFVNVNHMVFMVGLPARGKTYIARKLCRYLNWCGIASKVVNVGQHRRIAAGIDLSHDFFRKDNIEAEKIRLQSYISTLNEGLTWLQGNNGNKVVIFDATNSTRSRRKMVYNFCIEHDIKPFFIESLVDDSEIISSFLKDIKDFSPDYKQTSPSDRFDDYNKRVEHYSVYYEEISDHCDFERVFSYIKTINCGKQFLVNNIDGYLQSQVVYYLMNIHVQKRSLYITVHGECEYNLKKELGGNSSLTETGNMFASALKEYMEEEKLLDLRVWTSPIKGCMETSAYINGPVEVWRNLEYLECGDCHGMKFADLAERFPDQFTPWCGPLDFHWRYPSGESYQDMLSRLEPVIMELERLHNVLVISHRTTIRCLMAYFLEHNPDEVPRIKVPLHTLFKVTPLAYGCRVEKASLNISKRKLV